MSCRTLAIKTDYDSPPLVVAADLRDLSNLFGSHRLAHQSWPPTWHRLDGKGQAERRSERSRRHDHQERDAAEERRHEFRNCARCRRREQLKRFYTLLDEKWLNLRPEPGLDGLTCSNFGRIGTPLGALQFCKTICAWCFTIWYQDPLYGLFK